MNILFITSFNGELFEASGKRLLESFLEVQKTGRLLVCAEGPGPYPVHRSIRYYDLDNDAFLHSWLHENRSIIPDYLGGEAKECSCPNREIRHAKHKRRCHWQWMNRNASRWFRKVASLRAALHEDASLMVWLDADAYFRAPLTVEYLRRELGGKGLFYFRGHRPAVESGVLAFDLARGGKAIIKTLCRRYVSGAFRKYERWDDGYQLASILDTDPSLPAVDLVHKTRWKGRTNDVIPTTTITAYVVHEKGRHGTGLDLMR